MEYRIISSVTNPTTEIKNTKNILKTPKDARNAATYVTLAPSINIIKSIIMYPCICKKAKSPVILSIVTESICLFD